MTDTIRTDRVRILVFVKRRQDMTKEQFSSYWRETHGKLFLSLNIVKTNILRYEQAHTDEKWISSPEMKALRFTLSDWDGVAIVDGESFEKIFEVFKSEEYQKVVAPDEGKFVDVEKCQMLPAGLVTPIP